MAAEAKEAPQEVRALARDLPGTWRLAALAALGEDPVDAYVVQDGVQFEAVGAELAAMRSQLREFEAWANDDRGEKRRSHKIWQTWCAVEKLVGDRFRARIDAADRAVVAYREACERRAAEALAAAEEARMLADVAAAEEAEMVRDSVAGLPFAERLQAEADLQAQQRESLRPAPRAAAPPSLAGTAFVVRYTAENIRVTSLPALVEAAARPTILAALLLQLGACQSVDEVRELLQKQLDASPRVPAGALEAKVGVLVNEANVARRQRRAFSVPGVLVVEPRQKTRSTGR